MITRSGGSILCISLIIIPPVPQEDNKISRGVWTFVRKASINILIVLLILIAGSLAIIFFAALTGLGWGWISGLLGFKGTAEDAIKLLGDPQFLISWIDAWIRWVAGLAQDFLKWLWAIIVAGIGVAVGKKASSGSGGGGGNTWVEDKLDKLK